MQDTIDEETFWEELFKDLSFPDGEKIPAAKLYDKVKRLGIKIADKAFDDYLDQKRRESWFEEY